MRLLPMQQSRAAVFSLLGHALMIALLTLVGGFGYRPVPAQGPIIQAVLVAAAPTSPAPDLKTKSDDAPEQVPSPTPTSAAPTPIPVVDEAPSSSEPEQESEIEQPADVTVAEVPDPPAEATIETAPATPDAPATDPEPAVANSAAIDSAPSESRDEPAVASSSATPAPRYQPLDDENERLLGRRLASWTGRFEPGEPPPILKWRKDGQQFSASLRRLPSDDVMGMEQLAVDVTTELDGQTLTTELRMTRLAFSNFAQFVDHWDPDVQIHDDEIDGRFHSNTEINVSRGGGVHPVFRGKVTLAAADIRTDNVGWLNRRAVFPAGLETRARRIALPAKASTLESLDLPEDHVQRFQRDAELTFYADGSYGWRDLGAEQPETRRNLTDDAPYYLIAEERVSLFVKGTVNGTVLVYSPERIVIVGDLRYAVDPRDPDADDYIGLVAERNVEIGEPDLTGPGDLELQASIYARRQFAVTSFRSRRSGTLRIYGSVTAGSVTATEPRFATKIEFDERLTKIRAPGFPLSDRYELESWSGEWRPLDPADDDASAR